MTHRSKRPGLLSPVVIFAVAFNHDRHMVSSFHTKPQRLQNNARPLCRVFFSTRLASNYVHPRLTRPPYYYYLRSSTSDDDNDDTIDTVDGPFQPSQLATCWGRRPLLIRNAFAAEASQLQSEKAWPNWGDVCLWASSGEDDYDEDEDDYDNYDDNEGDFHVEEMPVMSRLIRKKDERMDSFTLEIGPFSKSYLEKLISTSDNDNDNEEKGTWTLLLNDVDRIHPPLSEWMNQTFGSFLPGWRIDDGQISIAKTGGGIGPHVDNYDVFLIQTSGQRQWILGDFISTEQEMDALIEGLEVRILDLDNILVHHDSTEQRRSSQTTKVEMQEGDMLYLPPRLIHWGTSQSDDCMTLSVGCRAPSATELVSKVAEHLAYSTAPKAVRRYTDTDLLSTKTPPAGADGDGVIQAGSITSQVKYDLKRMVLEAVEDVLDNPVLWDEIVGSTVTTPKRPIETYSHFADGDNGNSDTADSPRTHVHAALQSGVGALYPTEGVSFATSLVRARASTFSRVFADGHMFEWEIPKDDDQCNAWSHAILSAIDKRLPLDKKLMAGRSTQLSSQTVSALEKLIEQGFLYYYDEEGETEEED